jgi:YgiT-type zinc finger domain-containing protein
MNKSKTPLPILSRCPTCGSDAIRIKRDDYRITRAGCSIVVPKLPRHECPNCGEVLLGYDAMKRVEDARKTAAPDRPPLPAARRA